MKTKNLLLSLAIISTAMFACGHGNATTVYQWTDANGVVHFSDVAPHQNGVTETRTINFEDHKKSTPTPHTYSIIDQANIIAAWNKQADEQWLARKRLELDQQRLAEETEANRQENKIGNRNELQSLPYYYVFPSTVNYRYRERRYGYRLHRRFSGSRRRETPDVARRHNRTAQSRAIAILNDPLF